MDDRLYLWTLNDDGSLMRTDIKEYKRLSIRREECIEYRDYKNKRKYVPLRDIDQLKHNRIVSYSKNYDYIYDIANKALFKKFIKAQEEYAKIENRYINFKEQRL